MCTGHEGLSHIGDAPSADTAIPPSAAFGGAGSIWGIIRKDIEVTGEQDRRIRQLSGSVRNVIVGMQQAIGAFRELKDKVRTR